MFVLVKVLIIIDGLVVMNRFEKIKIFLLVCLINIYFGGNFLCYS